MRAAGGKAPPAASRRLRLAVLIATVSLVAAACGDREPALPTPPPPSPSVATTAVPSTAAPATDRIPESAPTASPPVAAVEFDVQGHRGARGLRPENTLPGFETALDLGVDTLELDLHFTADGEVVVWHDPSIDPAKCRRVRGTGPDPQGDQEQIAIALLERVELTDLACDMNPDERRFPEQEAGATPLAGDRYQIVTLAELFEFVANYADSPTKTPEQRSAAAAVMFNVETKRRPDRPATINDGFDGVTVGPFEIELLATIAEFDLEDRVIIQSFDHRSLQAVREANPGIRLAALTSRNQGFSPDFSAYAEIWSPDYRSLSASSLEEAHESGLLVIPWTVNETADMRRLIELGVDGLISDRPDLLLEVVGGRE